MGGNVFAEKTASILREHVNPTLDEYFKELASLFPRKSNIFNQHCMFPLGSVGKKPVSGDIDLGIDTATLLDSTLSDDAIVEWGINPCVVLEECNILTKRARTASPKQLRTKAFLKSVASHINKNATFLYCDEKRVTDGNLFSLYPQKDITCSNIGTNVQIDWMIGPAQWLNFSYYSSEYPESSNVKGLHRTQLILAAFQIANLSFNHLSGVKDKTSGIIIAENPEDAIELLNSRLQINMKLDDTENYYTFHNILQNNVDINTYNNIIDIYFKILDSTRADIPDNLQENWRLRRDTLGLTGKFLPESSLLLRGI